MSKSDLKFFSLRHIQGHLQLEAVLDRESCAFASHVVAIDVLEKNEGEERCIASIDPWQSKIELRKRVPCDDREFRIVARIGEQDTVPLSDWRGFPHE